MAVFRKLLIFTSITLLINIALASPPVQDWGNVAATLQNTLDVLQLSQEQYSVESSHLSKRAATFRVGRAGYWQHLPGNKRLDPSEDISGQLNDLVGEIGNNLQQLLALLESQFNVGGTMSSAAAPSTPVPTPVAQSILPITNLNTPPASLTSHAATTSRSLVPDRPLYTSIPSPSATYTFSPLATDLNVVYYSQTDLTPFVSLTQICNDPNVDIVILAFVTHLVAAGGYPAMNMASNCWAPNAAQQTANATNLLDCVGDGSAAKIAQYQQQGKKVMLSLGGSVGDLSLSSEAQAVQVANTLWNLFLGGTDPTVAPMRPYGSVILDGIDVDNESLAGATHLPTLARTLRSLMSSAPKPYYLSAAPKCPRPDASIPLPLLLPYIDFFSVQFYNNPSCNLNSGANFLASLQNWSSDLLALNSLLAGSRITRSLSTGSAYASPAPVSGAAGGGGSAGGFEVINNGIPSPRLLIGTPAFPAAGSGFVDVPTYKTIMESVKALNLPNLAGAMYWDGAYLERSGVVIDGINTTYAGVVKEVFG